MSRIKTLVVFMVVIFYSGLTHAQQLRTWWDNSGTFSRVAVFRLMNENGTVALLSDSQILQLPLSKLSLTDQTYVKLHYISDLTYTALTELEEECANTTTIQRTEIFTRKLKKLNSDLHTINPLVLFYPVRDVNEYNPGYVLRLGALKVSNDLNLSVKSTFAAYYNNQMSKEQALVLDNNTVLMVIGELKADILTSAARYGFDDNKFYVYTNDSTSNRHAWRGAQFTHNVNVVEILGVPMIDDTQDVVVLSSDAPMPADNNRNVVVLSDTAAKVLERKPKRNEPCRSCHGSGFAKCPNLKCARGTIAYYENRAMGHDQITGRTYYARVQAGRVTCPVCNGTGRGGPCRRCDGIGIEP